MMLDPFGFSLAGCRRQTVGYGAASVHCHAGIQWKGKKKKIELCTAPYFYILFLSFSMGCFLSFTKESQNKGIYTEGLRL